MNGTAHLMWLTSDRVRRLVLCVISSACVVGYANTALAQYVSPGGGFGGGYSGGYGGGGYATGQAGGGVDEPPLSPPVDRQLPTGQGMLSIGPWLLSPALDISTFYNSNIYGSTTNRLSGPGFRINPSLLADWDTGIHDIKLYGNIDSAIYPTLNPVNDTFNRQAGVIDTYSPLTDLTFSAQGNYAFNSLTSVIPGRALPSPIISPANPLLPGAAGFVVANPFLPGAAGFAVPQQSVVNPNQTFSASFNAAKQFNRAFLNVGGTILRQEFQNTPTQNYDQGAYYGNGGAWITPLFYAYADAIDSNTVPVVGSISNSYLARVGIGSAQIWLFKGSVYYGHQGTSVDGDGKAGGDIYGGVLQFFPTPLWDMNVRVDRVRNLSDITGATNFGLAGLAFAAAPVATSSSVQVTSVAGQTNYRLSDQTSLYASVSNVRTSFFNEPLVENSWFVGAGVTYQARDNLSLTLNYTYTRFLSTQPNSNFTTNIVTLGTHYSFN